MNEVALASAPVRTFGPGQLRVVGTLLLFAIGIAAGAFLHSVVAPPPPPNPYAQLPVVGEPPASADIVAILLRDDARTLAAALDQESLTALGQALQPVDEVFEAKFVGATERNGDLLAAYVLSGRSQQAGDKFPVGIVFRVRDGKVVGVN